MQQPQRLAQVVLELVAVDARTRVGQQAAVVEEEVDVAQGCQFVGRFVFHGAGSVYVAPRRCDYRVPLEIVIMRTRFILLASIFPLLSACIVVHTAVVKSTAADSFDCAAGVLNQMGYAVIFADEDLGVMRAERLKPAEWHYLARTNGDRIVVIVTPLDPGRVRMVTRGETINVLPERARPLSVPRVGIADDTAVVAFLSPEVRADTRTILSSCKTPAR